MLKNVLKCQVNRVRNEECVLFLSLRSEYNGLRTVYNFTDVCAIGEYDVVSVHTCWHPDHSDILNTQGSKKLKL